MKNALHANCLVVHYCEHYNQNKILTIEFDGSRLYFQSIENLLQRQSMRLIRLVTIYVHE